MGTVCRQPLKLKTRGSCAICAKYKSAEREAWASLANDVVRTGSDIMAIQAQPRAQ